MDDSKNRPGPDGNVEPPAHVDSPCCNSSNDFSDSSSARLIRLRLEISARGAMSRIEMDNLAKCVAAISGYPLDFEYRRRELDIVADAENVSLGFLGQNPATRFEADIQALVAVIPRHMSVKLNATLITDTGSHRVKCRFALRPDWTIKRQTTIDEEAESQRGSNSDNSFWHSNTLTVVGIILLAAILATLHIFGFIRVR